MYNLTPSDFGKAAAGRCWEGYKPVPGKKAYSDGSCQPVGGKKKKKKKTEKTAAVSGLSASPFGLTSAITSKAKIAPHSALLGATLGAGVGGIKGLFDGGDYDKETGERDNRIQALLKGMAGGAGLGGLAGAALPYVAGSPLYGDTVGKLHKALFMHQTGLNKLQPSNKANLTEGVDAMKSGLSNIASGLGGLASEKSKSLFGG